MDARALRPRSCFLAGLLALGCLTPGPAAAQEWYELYGSGVEALRGGQGQKAASLLRRAIQKRPEPGTNVPTYGTNFEPRYFPYLRLADACLLLGATEDASKALEISARFGTEPAAERAALEARVRAALEAARPPTVPPAPEPAPVAASAPGQPLAAAPAPTPTVASANLPAPPAALPATPPPSSTTTASTSEGAPGPARPRRATSGGPPCRRRPRRPEQAARAPNQGQPADTPAPAPAGPALSASHLDRWAVAGAGLIALVAVGLWTRGVVRPSREPASRPSTSAPTASPQRLGGGRGVPDAVRRVQPRPPAREGWHGRRLRSRAARRAMRPQATPRRLPRRHAVPRPLPARSRPRPHPPPPQHHPHLRPWSGREHALLRDGARPRRDAAGAASTAKAAWRRWPRLGWSRRWRKPWTTPTTRA